jgi:hypothetical protein
MNNDPSIRLSMRWLVLLLMWPLLVQAAEPLPSWREGPSRTAIVEFVQAVTADGSRDFVLPAERIAVFDNDGTLWSEQPLYFQVLFALEEVKRLAPGMETTATFQGRTG